MLYTHKSCDFISICLTRMHTLSLSLFVNSRDYLRDHPYLVREDTASYLTMWCVNLEMEEVHVHVQYVL